MVGVRNQSDHSADFYKHLVKRFGEFGLKIYRIANLGVHNVPEITLNLPGRDAKIAEFKAFIRNLSAAGIRYNTYAHMANGIWTTGRAVGRGGMDARMLDIADAKGYWDGQVFEGEFLIGIELLETVKAYLSQQLIHSHVVFTVALIAIGRKVIILDIYKLDGLSLIGIAAIIIALSLGFFLVKKMDEKQKG